MDCGEKDRAKRLWSFVSIVVPSKKCMYESFLLLEKKPVLKIKVFIVALILIGATLVWTIINDNNNNTKTITRVIKQ